jgi:hypothetical protein
MFYICSMNFVPTNAASAETEPRSMFAVRFGWLMFGIERLGMKLTRLLSRDVPEKRATADQCEAWLLVSRSVRWLHALQARLARGGAAGSAETAPAETGPAETGPAKAALANAPVGAQAVVVKAGDAKAKRQRLRTADDEIRGKSTEAVVARICANLGTAALLLGDAQAARRAAQLAEQARALLNGEPEPEINPRSPEYDLLARDVGAPMPEGATSEGTMSSGSLSNGVMPARAAPDTG